MDCLPPTGGLISPRRRSLATELAICLVVLVALVQGGLLLFMHLRQADYLNRQLQAKADEYAFSLHETLAFPLWEYDDEQIRRIGDSFARNSPVTAIEVRDAKGNILYQLGSQDAQKQITREVDIVHEGRSIGTAGFSLSLDTYGRDLAWFRNSALLMLVGSLAVIAIITTTLFRYLMRHPLTVFCQGMDRVARGEYDYRFDEVQHQELSEIARRFSTMAATIRQREQALQEEVAERKRAEELIRQTEARSRAILNAIPDAIFQFDRAGRCLDMRGVPGNLPLCSDQCIGRTIDQLLPEQIAATFRQQLAMAFTTREVQVFEYQVPHQERLGSFECRLAVVSDKLVLAMVRDITERVNAAAEKRRLLDQLQRAQKMEAIGVLAGGVAHDLNNVLSGLVSYPEMMLLELPDDSPLQKPIRIIQKSGERAATIVQDLLTLARRGVSVAEVVNLNRVIGDYLKSPEFARILQYHPWVTVEPELADDLLDVVGSAVHLTKTIMNLISNAAEATMDHGIIRLTTSNRYIDRPVTGYDTIEEGDYVVVEVGDSGIGMSPADIGRIFEPFYTKKVMGRSGTGLGMAVVWGTVKDHRGYIDVQSAEGRGTTVTVYLPATRERRLQDGELIPVDAYLGGGQRILVVDDVEEQRDIATLMLAKVGYRAESVASGEEAVALLAKERVDLLVLDMIMEPGIDGLETYRRIVDLHPGQPAVITSGYSESHRVLEARRLGAGAYVKKPYRLETLARAVKETLAGR